MCITLQIPDLVAESARVSEPKPRLHLIATRSGPRAQRTT